MFVPEDRGLIQKHHEQRHRRLTRRHHQLTLRASANGLAACSQLAARAGVAAAGSSR